MHVINYSIDTVERIEVQTDRMSTASVLSAKSNFNFQSSITTYAHMR